jgi:hypothetical protein
MNKKLILFSHHYVNDIIVDRFNVLKKLNPTWDVISIGFEGYDLLPNSIVTNKEKYPTNHGLVPYSLVKNVDWADPDIFLYDGYFQKPNYDSYFLYEYDTISNVSIEEFFNTNVDFFGNYICDPAPEEWWWVEKYRLLNQYNTYFNKLYGYGASTCVFMSNDIIRKCSNEVISNKHLYNNMLSEVRGGTLVSQFTSLKKGRNDIEKYISWKQELINIDLSKDYFYHPIK